MKRWEDYSSALRSAEKTLHMARKRGLIPDDDGTLLRRLRIWNIRHHFAVTFIFWIVIGFIVWRAFS